MAPQTPLDPSGHPGRGRSRWTAGACGAAVVLGLAACHLFASPPTHGDAIKGQTLGRVVDSLVIPPFERGAGVQINGADLELFRSQLAAQLTAVPGRKVYPAPPTTLPNTVTLSGTLAAFEVHEQTAEGQFLRTIDMDVDLSVRVGAEKDPALTLSRAYSYQKLYRTGQGAAALEYDLHNAAREATGALVAVLAPSNGDAPSVEAAIDPVTGMNYSDPLLSRGVWDAEYGRYDSAVAAWTLVLYNPGTDTGEERYRVSHRTLARLAHDGANARDVDALKPLSRRDGDSLEVLRDQVVRVLGPNSPLEPKVLQLSNENTNRIQLNLARAHFNLASLRTRVRRYDLAAYHAARAYAFDPTPAYLEAWLRIQARRDLVPKNLKPDAAEAVQWMRAYQLVPAPFTATVAGGAYERNVIPSPAFPSEGAPARAPSPPAASPALLPGRPAQPPAAQPRAVAPPGARTPAKPALRTGG